MRSTASLLALALASTLTLSGCGGSSGGSPSAASTAAARSATQARVVTGAPVSPKGPLIVGSPASPIASGAPRGGTPSASNRPGASAGTPAPATPSAPTPPPAPQDDEAPQVTITAPTRNLVTRARSVRVVGRVTDNLRLAEVMIAGDPVSIGPNGSISKTVSLVEGINQIEVRAIDAAGNATRSIVPVLAGDFARAGELIPEAVTLRINRDAFPVLERTVNAALRKPDLSAALLNAKGPLSEKEYRFVKATVLRATEAEIGRTSVKLTPTDRGVRTAFEIDGLNLLLKIRVKPRIGPSFVLTTRLTTSRMRMTTTLDARLLNRRVLFLDKGMPIPSVRDTSVRLDDFSFNVRGVPTFLETALRSRTRDKLEAMLAKDLPPKLGLALFKALSGVMKAPIRKRLLGRPATIRFKPEVLDFDAQGILIQAAADFSVPSRREAGPGSIVLSEALPSQPARRQAFDATVSLDLLNRVSYAFWRAGALDLQLHKSLSLPAVLKTLDGFQLGSLVPQLQDKVALPDAIEAEVEVGLPPVFKPGKAGSVRAQLGDLKLALYARKARGPRQLVARLALHLDVPVTTRVVGRDLKVSLGSTSKLTVEAIETPLGEVDVLALQPLVDLYLPTILRLQGRVLSGFPLPVDGKLRLANLKVSARGKALRVAGDLH